LDPSGATYYVDVDNNSSTWISPLLPHVKQVIEAGRMYAKKPSSDYFESTKHSLWMNHAKELEGWHGPLKTEEGHSYFWNSATQQSTWNDPRLSAQFYYELQSSLLKHLEQSLTAPQDTDDPFDASKGPPWEMRQASARGMEQFSGRGNDAAMNVPASIDENQRLILAENSPQPLRKLGEKATRVNQMLEASHNHKEQSFMVHKMSSTAEWVRSAAESEESLQRSRLTQKRKQRLEDRKVRDEGRTLAEAIHDPAINTGVFLGTAPLEIREPWIEAATPREEIKPWQLHQPRCYIGWQPWELWSRDHFGSGL
jgi:hypothetical protein